MFTAKKIVGAFTIITILLITTACGSSATTSTPTPSAQATSTQPAPASTEAPTATPGIPPIPTLVNSATPGGQATPTGTAAAANPPASGGGAAVADKYLYVGQSVADNKQFLPGAAIAQSWTIRNVGSTTWSSTYALRFFAGPTGSGPAIITFGKSVVPGGSITINATIKMPTTIGDYDTWYKVTNDQLQNFGDLDFKYTVSNEPKAGIQPTATP